MIKSRFFRGLLEFYQTGAGETVQPIAPVVFKDDFLGKILDVTNVWGTRDAGAATEAIAADEGNGAVALALDATNEVQVAGIDWGDQRPLILNQGLIAEFRFRLSVLPTGAVVMCVGLCGDYNAAVNTVAESMWFRADGNGVITVETDDTAHETSQVATGKTLTTADWMIGRIDATTITDVKFYIDGVRVAAGTTFDMSQVAGLKLQPVCRIGKEGAATTVGTLLVDKVQVWQNRS
jgi:hypothetical protein